jgi:hypothetical protein
MNGESARPGAPSNHIAPYRIPLAGRAIAHLCDGSTYCGWVELNGHVVSIEGRLRTPTGPSDRPSYIYRARVARTFPLWTVRRIDWIEGCW